MTNRRGFLAALIAGAVLGIRNAHLWRPGKLISIPKAAPLALRIGDIISLGWTFDPLRQQYIVTEVGLSTDRVRFRIKPWREVQERP